jgi:hypothetical protein
MTDITYQTGGSDIVAHGTYMARFVAKARKWRRAITNYRGYPAPTSPLVG